MNKNTTQTNDEILNFLNDADAVTESLQAGINIALLKHKKLGNPICVWKDNKVVWIAPEDIQI